MATISQLQKQAKSAPKFALQGYKDGVIFYVSDPFLCKDAGTVNIDKAQRFSFGFDDEKIKSQAWGISFGVPMRVIRLVG